MGSENTLQAELGLIVIEWSLMTLDISSGVLQSRAAVVQVCASAFTLMHFKKAYITQTRTHTHS